MTREEKNQFKHRVAQKYGIHEEDIDDALIPFLAVVEANTLGTQKLGAALKASMEAFEKSITAKVEASIKPKVYQPPSVERMSAWKAFWVTLAANPYFSPLIGVTILAGVLGMLLLGYDLHDAYQQRATWKKEAARALSQQLHEKYFQIQTDGSLFMTRQNYQVVKGSICLEQK
ncbi:hypothetical protein BWI97_25690 [Siphonobacter sp. BAB-5405]|uniref:hypothetical protein n=1 Tax=Siphonobacter sp. BAB-5405 TaxID=1864825 RepID=UPI000C801638|nr:hypothetical protein [Siphonobacter sp. BAB-5405]PMD87570.1 hypothetical protein BWI97_25690 [Siphonobacter sp. BAB-5405]